MIAENPKHPLWAERYRPARLEDIILPNATKEILLNMAHLGSVPVNLLFAGGPGIGKTTAALALLNHIGADVYRINASLDGNIDTLRFDIMRFASTVSFTGGRKFILLDEADHLTVATQPALRSFMEEFSENAGFILTCNRIEKIIEPLQSRCSRVDFTITPAESVELKVQFLRRLCAILENEKVEYEKEAVMFIIDAYFPDMRRALNFIQPYARYGSGVIGEKVMDAIENRQEHLLDLIGYTRSKNFTEARRWLGEFVGDYGGFYRAFYDISTPYLAPSALPQLVVLIAKYQYMGQFGVDPEVNAAAFVAEAMVTCEFI